MKVEFYGFNHRHKLKKWYTEFTGVKLFGRKFLGFSIFNDRVVVQVDPRFISKTSTGIWLTIFFYEVCIELKDPWKSSKS
jgi:hypothetical protein